MKKQLHLVWVFFLIPAMAWADFASTPQEQAMCQALIYNGRDTSDRDNWRHMHHFCDCIRFTNRAYAALGNWSEMKYNLEIGIGGCDYVFSHTTPNFYMRPEIHLQKGKALRLFKQEGKAIVEFMEAIKGKPALAQAYVEMADILSHNKKPQEALKTVSEGLRQAPDSKPLQRRYTELGGKLPYPEPVKTEQPATASPVESSQTPTSPAVAPPDPTSPAAEQKSSEIPPAAGTSPVEKAAPPTSSGTISGAPIGSPSNHWCRFCP